MQNMKLRKIVFPQVILRTIGISHAQAPLLQPQMYDNQGRIMPLNAYVLDFYKHGSLLGLVQDNRYVLFASIRIGTSISIPMSTSTSMLFISVFLDLHSSPSLCSSLALSPSKIHFA